MQKGVSHLLSEQDRRAREVARRWFNVEDAGFSMWALFAAGGFIEDVPRMREALREGAVPDPADAGILLRYIEARGERGPVPGWTVIEGC